MSWSAKYALRKLPIRISACSDDATIVCLVASEVGAKIPWRNGTLCSITKSPSPQALKRVGAVNKATNTRLAVHAPDSARRSAC